MKSTDEKYWHVRTNTNTNTVHTAKTAIPIQYQLKLHIFVYETWLIKCLDIVRDWKMCEESDEEIKRGRKQEQGRKEEERERKGSKKKEDGEDIK